MTDFLFALSTVVGGVALLVGGGELLVRGALSLAGAMRISPLVIGLTVVAFGSSSPELAVSIQSALAGSSDVALGNVVGSNIFNVLFILGLSSLILPLVVSIQLIRRDVPLMIAVSFLFFAFAVDGNIERLEGGVLTLGLLAYTCWTVWQSRKEENAAREAKVERSEEPSGKFSLWKCGVYVVLGLVLLTLGSRWLVDGSTSIARMMGVSELIIGLTIVAVGTSLPELATSVLAAARGERDIAVGNVIGSNLFNILGVLGLSSLISPEGIVVSRAAIAFDIPVMLAVAIACLPVFLTGHLVARWEGALFLAFYLAYTAFLSLDAMQSEYLRPFSVAMGLFVIPLTLITIVASVIRHFRNEPKGNRDAVRRKPTNGS